MTLAAEQVVNLYFRKCLFYFFPQTRSRVYFGFGTFRYDSYTVHVVLQGLVLGTMLFPYSDTPFRFYFNTHDIQFYIHKSISPPQKLQVTFLKMLTIDLMIRRNAYML